MRGYVYDYLVTQPFGLAAGFIMPNVYCFKPYIWYYTLTVLNSRTLTFSTTIWLSLIAEPSH